MRACVVATVMGAGLACAGQADRPPPPPVTSPAWFSWYDGLLAQRLAECPLERGQTYYFSQSGDDATGNGSIGSPWRTLAKAKQVLDGAAPAGDVAVLFRRGDVWRESVGIEVATKNVTIADYGVGEKPLLTAFRTVGDPTLWSPTAGFANVYQRPAAQRVMWAKQDNDLDRPWSRQRTLAGVNATEGSWCWLKGTLYVHPRHVAGAASDPRVDGNAYETVGETSSPGVRVRGDGSRIENIRAQGWGLTAQFGTQIHGIESQVRDADRAVIVGCESHYGLSHVMTHWSPQGGVATFTQCKAGLTTYSFASGETMFNTYSYFGGTETIFDHCEATHGTLPSDDFPTGKRLGVSFYGHTSAEPGAYLGLTIANACVTRDTPHGCASPAGFSNLTPGPGLETLRCFVVGERAQGLPGDYWRLGAEASARVNGVYAFRPTSGSSMNAYVRGWVINCTVNVDCTAVPGDYAFTSTQPGNHSGMQMWNSEVRVTTRPGQTFRFDASVPSYSSTCIVGHCVLVCEGGGTLVPNLGLPPPVRRRRGQPAWPLKSNAYFGVEAASVAKDPFAVVLAAAPASSGSLSCSSVLACAAVSVAGEPVLGYDQRGMTGYRNDLGPIEAFVCANCDESTVAPVLNGQDFLCFMTKFTSGDATANCDGSTVAPVLNAQDFVCFQDAFTRGCR
jgi:hypothetical protein